MNNRIAVLGLAAFLAAALAVPALGGPSNPIASSAASAKKTAKKALTTANAAQTAANNADVKAGNAQAAANNADAKATSADTKATAAQTTANNALAQVATKFDNVTSSSGSSSPSDNADKSPVVDTCPGAREATGGGYSITGAAPGSNDAQVILNIGYGSAAWIVTANDRGQFAGNWGVTVFTQCVGT